MKKLTPKGTVLRPEDVFCAEVMADMIAPIVARTGQTLTWGPTMPRTTLFTMEGDKTLRKRVADARTPLLLARLVDAGVIEPLTDLDARMLREYVGGAL